MAIFSMFGKHFSNFCSYVLDCFSVLYVLRPLFLFPTVWKAPYTSVIFSDSPLRLPTCHPPSFFLQTEAQARFSSPQRAWNQTVNCWSYPCHADGWECVSPTKFMEDLEHVRWKLLRQEKMIFAKAGGYFRSQSVSVLAQCDVSLLTCLFCFRKKDAHRENCWKYTSIQKKIKYPPGN